jgi:hypothetical protein
MNHLQACVTQIGLGKGRISEVLFQRTWEDRDDERTMQALGQHRELGDPCKVLDRTSPSPGVERSDSG